jgi:hypothetical protein
MSYELKEGQGMIFKNTKKEKESQPEYRGEIKTPSGELLEISLWVKEGKNGKFFSASIKPPYKKDEQLPPAETNKIPNDDLGLPF